MGFREWLITKLNPAQPMIQMESGTNIGSDGLLSYRSAFEKLESVSRGTNMIVNGCASLDFDIKEKISSDIASGMRQKTLATLLNFRPNLYQSAQEFRTSIFTDFILEGNIFIYFDGAHLHHLPAASVQIQSDPKVFIAGYTYNNTTNFKANEIIHIRDLSSHSVYRGTSRLQAAARSVSILYKMQAFQESFFENGAIPGIVLISDNTLSQVAKDKTIQNWMAKYNPKNGARRPMILDSGLKPSSLLNTSFQDMDFDNSIKSHDIKILKALGVPSILLDGGNNANISPNLRLFYLETVMPIVRKYTSAMERFFGYDVEAITSNVSSLQPDLKDIASYHSTLVNAGILTANEARLELRYPAIVGKEGDDLRIPANIAGSAANPSQGGAPTKEPKKEYDER
jgi:HK97 family phage portal protein